MLNDFDDDHLDEDAGLASELSLLGEGVPAVLAALPLDVRALLTPPGGHAEFTLILSELDATKRYGIESGQPKKMTEPGLSSGSAHRAAVKSLNAFNAALQHLPQNAVLVCGAMTAAGDNIELTTKAKLPGKPGATARIGGWSAYGPDQPGLFVVDHDAKDLPAELLARVSAAGGIEGVLASVFPEFGRAGVLVRPSVSTGIRCKSTGAATPGGSVHLYAIAKDGGDIKAFVRRLHNRLILDGWGWVFVTKAGVALMRSPIDATASGDPERLVFEADGVLDDPDLELVPGAREGLVYRDGTLLNTLALSELSASERAQLAAVEAALLVAKAPEITQLQAQVRQERAAQLVASGVSPAQAQARAAKSIGSERLDIATVLHLDDGRKPTVEAILRSPQDYDGATGGDPVEPDYGGGKNKAILGVGHRHITYTSQAHGGQRFILAWTAADLVAAWTARRDPAEIASMWTYLVLEDPQADEAAIAVAGVPSARGLEFGLDALQSIPDLIKQNDTSKLAGLHASLRGVFEDQLRAVAPADAAAVLEAIAARPTPVVVAPAAISLSGNGWEARLAYGRDGLPKPNLSNAALGLGEGCELSRHLWLDVATCTLVLKGVLQNSREWRALGLDSVLPIYADPITGLAVFQWAETMLTNARCYLDTQDLRISKEAGRDTIAAIAARNTFSSVGTYLRALRWDGIPRLDGWLVRNAGAADGLFNKIVLAKWMIGAVARGLFPEEHGGQPAKVDTILTLAGAQEAKKSTFLRRLCALPLWHTENGLGDLTNKDAVLRIASTWIVDMSEGGSLRANEVEAFKQFITVLADNVRLPYAPVTTRQVRRCVFAMTVNPDGTGFLRDGTGNRRFWVVEVDGIDIGRLELERDQLWAEAVERLDAGEKWWFDKSDPADAALAAESAAAAEGHRSRTPVEEALRRYLVETPSVGAQVRTTWTRRAHPLSVLGPLADVLAEMGFDERSTANSRDAARALRTAALGWRNHRVRHVGAVVERDTSIWVSPAGARAIDEDIRAKSGSTAFRGWLDAEATAGRIDPLAVAKPAALSPGGAKSDTADFTDVTLKSVP